MTGPYHEGERLVQVRAGVTAQATKLAGMFRADLPPAAPGFLVERELLVVASVDGDGRVWASLLADEPGFARAVDERTVRIHAAPSPDDPLAGALRAAGVPAPVGILAIDFATRRRMRINGTARLAADGAIEVHTRQVYSNCPKYIQARPVVSLRRREAPIVVSDGDTLSAAQRQWIQSRDTFFIATAHPTAGLDASHRGGNPGFVRADDPALITFPDYAGNNMFNTLGNIAVNPAAGLLFLDFVWGRTLQVTGGAAITWAGDAASTPVEPSRHVNVRVTRAIETTAALPHHYGLPEFSPFNPSLACQ